MNPYGITTSGEVAAAVLLAIQVGAVVAVASLVTPRIIGPDRLLRALVWLVLVVAQCIGVPLALAAAGILSAPTAIGLHLALLVGVWSWSRSTAAVAPDADPGVRANRLWVAAAAVAGLSFVLLALYLSLRGGRSMEFDTREYHISNLASWLRTRSLWTLPYAAPGAITATHPGNGEMFGLWLALPTHGDQLVYAMPLPFAAMAILSAAVAARELTGGMVKAAALGALGMVAVLTAPVYFLTQVDSLHTDITSAACLLAAVALLLARRQGAAAAVVPLAGVAVGLGLGSKYTAFLPSAALALGALVVLRRKREWWGLVPGVLLFAGPWFLRNALATGNPLFPQAVGPLSGNESPFNLLDTSMLRHLLSGDTDVARTWFRLARTLIGPAVILIAVGPLFALRRRLPDRQAALTVVGVTAAAFIAYLATPFSGGGPTGLAFMIASCFRYGLFFVLVAVMLSMAFLNPRVSAGLVAVTLAWNLWKITGKTTAARPDMLFGARVLVVVIAAGLLGTLVLAALRTRAGARVPVPAVAVVVLGLVAAGGFGALHRIDARRPSTRLEATLLRFGRTTPAIVVGAADIRAALGPRLERQLLSIGRGGAADEIPYVDENQIRRRVLNDTSVPMPPAEFIAGFSNAIDSLGAPLLVVGATSPIGYPDGWVPSPRWCKVGGDPDAFVYVRGEVLGPNLTCETAAPGSSPVGATPGAGRSVPGG